MAMTIQPLKDRIRERYEPAACTLTAVAVLYESLFPPVYLLPTYQLLMMWMEAMVSACDNANPQVRKINTHYGGGLWCVKNAQRLTAAARDYFGNW